MISFELFLPILVLGCFGGFWVGLHEADGKCMTACRTDYSRVPSVGLIPNQYCSGHRPAASAGSVIAARWS